MFGGKWFQLMGHTLDSTSDWNRDWNRRVHRYSAGRLRQRAVSQSALLLRLVSTVPTEQASKCIYNRSLSHFGKLSLLSSTEFKMTIGQHSSRLLSRWPGTHSRILSGIQRAAQTV